MKRFSHVFVTRPRAESEQLAALLAPLGMRLIVQPAFDFRETDASSEQADAWGQLLSLSGSPLLIFTSTRAVSFGLNQLPADLIARCTVAAIGPSTSLALGAAGVRVNIRPESGFTSEALLQVVQKDSSLLATSGKFAFILAAPGGRTKMEEGLRKLGWDTQVLMVYRRENADIDRQQLRELSGAKSVLSVWTSSNSMKALSHRMSPGDWFRLCQGEWLVISDRLKRLARAYSPGRIHLSPGPTNEDLYSAISMLSTLRD